MLRRTLDGMRAGGVYDQLGGGFARYSVDERWLIPHFEKMLYDNALLARVYLRAGQVLDEPLYTDTARATLDYLATELRDPSGGIHAAEDADSAGVEGKFYVWSWDEFMTAAGPDADVVADLYGVTREGNFDGLNNLHLATTISELSAGKGIPAAEVSAARARVDGALLAIRQLRIRPGRDDKVIAAWNGLALRAFAEAAAVLDSAEYIDVAIGIADFVTTEMVRDDGRLLRSWRQGRTSGPAFCDDYAAMAVGLFTLFQATGDETWFHRAERLVRQMVDLFGDEGGFYSSGADNDDLITRPKDFADNPLPSANSLAAEALIILAAYTGEPERHVAGITRGAALLLERHPTAVGHLLSVLITQDHGLHEVAVVGPAPARQTLEQVVWETYRPACVLASGDGNGRVPLLDNRGTAGAQAAAHVCHDFVCDLPVTSPEALRKLIDD